MRVMIGESRKRCISACIGHSRTGTTVPIGDMVDVFGAEAVLAVAREMPTAGPEVVRRLTAAADVEPADPACACACGWESCPVSTGMCQGRG
jgi:hypothetical protein